MTVLYITENGITDHIGRSQVAPYILGLANLGFKIHVLSAEKAGREDLIDYYQELFDVADVRWTRVRYRNKPPILGHALTQAAMRSAANYIVKHENVHFIHCRSIPPTLIAMKLKKNMGIKYIFDFRDFYADSGMFKTRGLSHLVFRRLKVLERDMVRQADKIVCLTERAKLVLSNNYLQDDPQAISRFQVIPCCADFSLFDSANVTSDGLARAREIAGLSINDFVLLYLGSIGPDYLLSEMMLLFKQIMTIQTNANFLFVSNNGKELVYAECKRQNISLDRIHFVSVDRREVPTFVRLADLSVVFIRSDASKIGCSPTKLTELFACNIPVIANTGVGDLDKIIDLRKNGSVIVNDFSNNSLSQAFRLVVESKLDNTIDIRENSREFALEEGILRYSLVYRELLGSE